MAEPLPDTLPPPVIEEVVQPPPPANDNQPSLEQRIRQVPEGKRINNLTALSMVLIAVFFDSAQFVASFIQFVPGIGFMIAWYLGILAELIFIVWFAFVDVKGGGKRRAYATRLLIYMSMFVVEVTPILEMLPAITLGVVAIIILTRAEDILGKDLKSVQLSDLSTLIRGQLPIAQFAQRRTEQERAQVNKEYPGTTAPKTRERYADQFKQRRIAAAMRQNLSAHAFTKEAEEQARQKADKNKMKF